MARTRSTRNLKKEHNVNTDRTRLGNPRIERRALSKFTQEHLANLSEKEHLAKLARLSRDFEHGGITLTGTSGTAKELFENKGVKYRKKQQ